MPVLEQQTAARENVSPNAEPLFISKEKMAEYHAIVARQFEDFGIEYDPTATAEDSRRVLLAAGFRPEDNEISRGIVTAREE